MSNLYPEHEKLLRETKQQAQLKAKVEKSMNDMYIFLLKKSIEWLETDIQHFEKICTKQFKATKKFKEGQAFMKSKLQEYKQELEVLQHGK